MTSWLNVGHPLKFLDLQQPLSTDNPYWIYPLHILEIKHEINAYAPDNLNRGVAAHFLNLHISINSIQRSYSTYKFDKRRSLPFKYTQFIKFSSNRPVKQSYNTIIFQVLPILYISTSISAAI